MPLDEEEEGEVDEEIEEEEACEGEEKELEKEEMEVREGEEDCAALTSLRMLAAVEEAEGMF